MVLAQILGEDRAALGAERFAFEELIDQLVVRDLPAGIVGKVQGAFVAALEDRARGVFGGAAIGEPERFLEALAGERIGEAAAVPGSSCLLADDALEFHWAP